MGTFGYIYSPNIYILNKKGIGIFLLGTCFVSGCKNYWDLGIYPMNVIYIAFSKISIR